MLFSLNLNRPKVLLKGVSHRLRTTRVGLRPYFKQSIQPEPVVIKAPLNHRYRFDKAPRQHKSMDNIGVFRMPTKSAKAKRGIVRHRILQFLFFISLAGMATQSLPAKASVFDPIKRVLSPVFSTKSTPAHSDALPDTILTEQSNRTAESEGTPTDNELLMLTQDRPSLFNIMQAEFLINRGDINQALALYKQESFKQDSTSTFERALELSLMYEPAESSLAFAFEWQQQNPEHIPALFYVAHLSLKASDYELASDVLTEILEYDPQADLSEILQGIYPTNSGDQRLLLETLLSLPKHNNPSILVLQAGLMSQLGQPDIALVSVNRALRIQPSNSAFIVLKADILKQLESDRDVLKYVSTQRKRLNDSKALYLYEIRYRLDLGQTQEAWELLLKAHDLFHDDEVTLLAALVSIDVQAYEQADDLLSGLAASPYYIDQAYYYLGISAERQQKFDRAERFLSKVMQENLVLKARQKLVSIQMLRGQSDRALDTLAKFSKQFEVYAPDSAIMQADILRQQNRLSDAQKILADTNRRFPDDTKLLFARAQLLDNEQDTALKKQLLDRLILLDPENPDYNLSMAVLLFETGNEADVNQALTIAQSILDLPFNSPLFKQDNYLSALNLVAADALSEERYNDVVDYLEATYDISPTLDSGIILLRAYQGLEQEDKVTQLFNDIQSRFALGQQDISDRLQAY